MNNSNSPIKLNVIAAVCNANWGIGKNMQLPWNLPTEYTNYRRLVEHRDDPKKKNVLIYGRKTWEMKPRMPNQDLIIIVISRSTDYKPPFQNCYIFPSIEAASGIKKYLFLIKSNKHF